MHKRMVRQKLKKIINSTSYRMVVVALAVLVAIGATTIQHVRADQYDEKIKQLQADSNAKQGVKSQLGVEAASLADAIAKLQTQIDALNASIQANQIKQADLQKQITAAEEELAKQKKVLGENIKAMYLEGQVTTLEMLASSKDLSEFVDKQQYRDSVKDKITASLAKINDLKHQLKGQKEQVEQLIKDQEGMQSRLDGQRAESAGLLSLNQGQQAELNNQIKQNSAAVAQLRSQQAAENAKLFNGANVVLGTACDTAHGDTYPAPWCSAGQDTMIDYWGMFNRECVSYTAWKVSESGRHMPYWGGVGNANQWDDNARSAGIPVDGNPRAGDVAIKNSLPYGHAMYVESVNSNGTINISQYNQTLDGRFSRAYNVSPSGLVFIHF